MAAVKEKKAQAKPETVELVSRSANLWISLETNVDDYNQMGGMRKIRNGTRVRFSRGRATVPAAWREDIEATRGFGRDFWYADDPRRVMAAAARQVVSGMATSHVPQPGDEPPLEGWDTLGAREIRAALEEGKVEDLRVAMAWETRPGNGKARVQVIDALGKAIRAEGEQDDSGEGEAPDTSEAEETEGAEGAEVDDDNGGL